MARDFDGFYEAEFRRVFRAAFAACGDRETAADATQEAFKRALIRWRRVSRHPSPGGWVMTTALNVVKRELRRRYRFAAGTPAPEQSLSQEGVERLDVADAIRRLPKRQQYAVTLYYIGDLSVAQIAHLMSISQGAVKAHLSQARRTLQRILEVKHG